MLKAKRQQYIKEMWKEKHSEIFSYVYSDREHSAFRVGLHRASLMLQNNTYTHIHATNISPASATFYVTGLKLLTGNWY